jgi:septum formation protein
VRFADPTDDEIDAYISSGEPLAVAGGFTLDGRGSPFVDSVEGNPGAVIGVSLPLVRRLLAKLDVSFTELW